MYSSGNRVAMLPNRVEEELSFITPGVEPAASSSPETLFRDLSRTPEGPRHLWAHQADMLRAYLKHVSDPDLAVELPTGAGKTLVGMLVAEWRRRARDERVVYLCPTVQLARQALADAQRAGIDVVDLTGPNREWNASDEYRYRAGEAVAVAHYSALFNSNPALYDAHLVVFDDAHAAAGSIADAWTVKLPDSSAAYSAVVGLLAEGLPTAAADRYVSRDISGAQWQDAHMVSPAVVASKLPELAALLAEHTPKTKAWYGWTMIRESLEACAVFVAADELIVRPILPPTSAHSAFTEPRQRLYLSATLGSGGELERAFGRTGISRMPVPAGWDERGTGRRFFVFPELLKDFATAGSDADVCARMNQFVSGLMSKTERSLLLAPSNRALAGSSAALVPADMPVVSADDIKSSLEPFTAKPRAVLALANRYDGIDLPDQACRSIVMVGLPLGADVQERFYAYTLGAKRVLQERTRTRFAQGSGRATRNTNDWALVAILGRELVSFCGQRDAQNETHPEIRAELEFGLMNSQSRSVAEVSANIDSFLAQDSTWREQAEPAIRAARDSARPQRQVDTAALAASAIYEVRAVDAAWRGDWPRAVRMAEQALAALAGGAELRPYQAFWNYVAAQWAHEASSGDPTYEQQSVALAKAAAAAAARTTWMPNRHVGRSDAATQEHEIPALDVYAAESIVALASELGTPRKVTRAITDMVDALKQTGASEYERGLVELGRLLGAISNKPMGEARADALWRWGDHLWMAWEAKSEVKEQNAVSADAIRQANTHLRAATADLDEELPPGSVNVLVTPQSAVDPSARALAADDLFLVSTTDVSAIADNVANLWFGLQGRLLSDAAPDQLTAAVLTEMSAEGVAPSALVARLRGSLF